MPSPTLKRITWAVVVGSALLVIGTIFTDPSTRYVARVGIRQLRRVLDGE